jgi:ABC-type glycerol-3-phosphate transport system permease component
MIGLVVFTALPLIYLVSTALKPMDELFIFPPRFLVRKPTLSNFSDLVVAMSGSTVPFLRYVFNSVFTTVIIVVITVIISAMGAYGLVKHKSPGMGVIFPIVIAALMFSTHITQIPNYLVVNGLGIVNTYWALIVPKLAVAYNFFLMKQFIEQTPNELLHAARIDGAGEWVTFWRIVMPSIKPAWATLTVLSFVLNWNDFISPLIFTSSEAMKTLPLAMQTIGQSIGGGQVVVARAGAVAACTLVITAPTVILFMIMQTRVMETMVHSGIKA